MSAIETETKTRKTTKAEAGALGGRACFEKHGRDYMREIGRRGAMAFHAKYRLVPYGTNDFMIVERATNRPNPKTLNGKPLPEHVNTKERMA